MYCNPLVAVSLKSGRMQWVEVVFVFFPFQVLRPLFPKTSFSASISNDFKTIQVRVAKWQI